MQSRNFSTRMLALVLTLLLAQPLALMAQGGSAPQLPNPGTTGGDLCQNTSAYYVNYHTTAFPGGAIRGQLH